MSYYPVKPPSPVPSYRSSSQSSGYTSSVTSVGASLSPMPDRANPKVTGYDPTPPSPSNSHGTHTGDEIHVGPPSPVSPYSELRARALSDQAYPEGYSPNDQEDDADLKNRARVMSATCAETAASRRAQKLMDKTVSEGVVTAGVTAYKTSIDRSREKWANARALQLLRETSAAVQRPTAEVHDLKPAGSSLGLGATMIAGQAAMRCYDHNQTALSLTRGKEHLATSSRPKRPLTAEDVRDPETVAGMKCELDIEREENARRRALRMLGSSCFA